MLLEILTDQQLRETIANSPSVLVVFYHRQCPACAAYKPTLRSWCQRNGSQSIYLIDTGRFDSIADEYRIKALPTSIMFVNGKPAARAAGTMSETRLQNFLTKNTR